MTDERGMNDNDVDDVPEEWVEQLRADYHAPGDTPREAMWSAIAPRLGSRDARALSLDEARSRRAGIPPRRMLGWAVATAALFVVGIGIGRSTAPSGSDPNVVVQRSSPGEFPTGEAAPLRLAALRHLERTEGLLTMVRADGRTGRIDPSVGPWATTLLSQTRLMLDYTATTDPAMRELLEDLELILVQIVGASEMQAGDSRTQEEVTIALDAIENHEVVPRIQALMPNGAGLAGV